MVYSSNNFLKKVYFEKKKIKKKSADSKKAYKIIQHGKSSVDNNMKNGRLHWDASVKKSFLLSYQPRVTVT